MSAEETIWATLDFESFYDKDVGYTLTKLTNEAYVRDERFEPLCLGVKINNQEAYAVPQEDLEYFVKSLPWHRVHLVAHHNQFDGLIFSHKYRVVPRLYCCTLSMARAVNFSKDRSLSLASLSDQYGLPEKTVPYNLFHGKRWADMDDSLRQLMLAGAARDCDNTWYIFKEIFPLFTVDELLAIDWTIRAYTCPQLEADIPLLRQLARDEQKHKEELLAELGLTKTDLASNDKFVAILEGLGVDVAMKVNAKGELKPALAKSDAFMKELLESEDEVVKTLVEARLAIKSTITETRSARIADMASRGKLCVYYYYCGAQNTTRHSGGDKMNWQNLSRKGDIRKAVKAPEGYKLIIVDKSQIECRILNTASGQWDVIEAFRNNEDVYCKNASNLYGREVTKEDKELRGTGKQIELSCGYGCGAMKFQTTAALGIYGPPVKLHLSEADAAVKFYRRTHPRVVEQWKLADYMLTCWRQKGQQGAYEILGVQIVDGYAILPTGLTLDYTTVEYDPVLKEYFFHHKKSFARNVEEVAPMAPAERAIWWYKRGYRGIYGAKIIEQITQALSACDYRQSVNRTNKRCTTYCRSKIYPAMSTHDEAVYVVPDWMAEKVAEIIHEEFAKAPTWMPDLPAAAEVIISERYQK